MKYIIDIPKTVGTGKVGSVHYTYFDGIQCQTIVLKGDEIEELNSDYINEHYGSLQDDAYQRGFDDAHRISEEEYQRGLEYGKQTVVGAAELREKLEYQRGLNDAWEAARKIIRMSDGDILDLFPDCYASVCTAVQAILKYDASEAIAKLKAYEEKQKADDEIKVGDEVYAYTLSGKTQPFIIIKIYDEDGVKYYSGINADGNHVQGGLNYIKTGRHFPHVVELLKAMKE